MRYIGDREENLRGDAEENLLEHSENDFPTDIGIALDDYEEMEDRLRHKQCAGEVVESILIGRGVEDPHVLKMLSKEIVGNLSMAEIERLKGARHSESSRKYFDELLEARQLLQNPVAASPVLEDKDYWQRGELERSGSQSRYER